MVITFKTSTITDFAIDINNALHNNTIDPDTALEKLVSVIPNTYHKKYNDREFNLRVGKDLVGLFPFFCRADRVYIRCYWNSEYEMEWVDLVEYLIAMNI